VAGRAAGALGGMAFNGGELWSGFTDESAEADGDVLSVEFFVCGGRARNHRAAGGFSIFRFLAYIKDELLIVLGTSSSETVLPDMMRKLEGLGASRSVVGLVFPTGYVFNTDGTNILPDTGGAVSGAGYQYASFVGAGERNIILRAGGIEGRIGRDWDGICDAGGDFGGGAFDSGAIASAAGGD